MSSAINFAAEFIKHRYVAAARTRELLFRRVYACVFLKKAHFFFFPERARRASLARGKKKQEEIVRRAAPERDYETGRKFNARPERLIIPGTDSVYIASSLLSSAGPQCRAAYTGIMMGFAASRSTYAPAFFSGRARARARLRGAGVSVDAQLDNNRLNGIKTVRSR